MTYTNAVVKREDFTDKEVDYAIDLLKEKIKFRLKQKATSTLYQTSNALD